MHIFQGYHGNEADLNCDCTVLIKDHDGTESNNLVNYLEMSKNHSVRLEIGAVM